MLLPFHLLCPGGIPAPKAQVSPTSSIVLTSLLPFAIVIMCIPVSAMGTHGYKLRSSSNPISIVIPCNSVGSVGW
jgi:hypothetical protein